MESSYVNIPVISFCNTDSPTKYVDIAIPCNIKSIHSVGLMWWLLAREVRRMRGDTPRTIEWDVMPDLYFFREETKKKRRLPKFLRSSLLRMPIMPPLRSPLIPSLLLESPWLPLQSP